MIFFTIVVFLLVVNMTPALLAMVLGDRGNLPLDLNLALGNGRPLFGHHKTIRGFLGAITAGSFVGFFMGFPFWVGFTASFLSMIGDLLSSMVKRRLNIPPGEPLMVLDQFFEASMPLGFFYKTGYLSFPLTLVALFFFVVIANAGSALSENIQVPGSKNRIRLVRSSKQFKQWRSCHEPLPVVAGYVNFENSVIFRLAFEGFLKVTGLYEKGIMNALNVRLKHVYITDSRLPEAFSPLKILFVSDLHIDAIKGLSNRFVKIIDPLDVDICLLGGDFRFRMFGGFYRTTHKLRQFVKHVHAKEGIFGVLGNHDCLEFAPELEDTGICMLINDAECVERNGARLWIVGVDDPHYYKCHDLEKALEKTGSDDYKILIAHSPEIIRDCKGNEVNLCLCGHTHGGQIRFPGIGAVYTHVRVPRRYTYGLWEYCGIKGYTTSGAGSSGVPVRFNCPPEIVLITVRRFKTV
ncbi:MAG: hypothetical protein DRG83_06370 [Deltaproteobacteria bacterium]|nr:MAG: hypothetical protein DRG83_06370 [Deltaproteobacteria bacterium]